MGCLKILGNVGKIFKGLNRVWTPRYLNNNDDIDKKVFYLDRKAQLVTMY